MTSKYTPEKSRALEDRYISGMLATQENDEGPGRGRPSKFDEYEALFLKHGELTASDIVVKFKQGGKRVSRHSVGNNLKYFWDRELLERTRIHNVFIYWLADAEGV